MSQPLTGAIQLKPDALAARWAGRFGAASTGVALALYGVVMAVDGLALKQAVNAWVSAAEPEKAARFASAEAIRWPEWGARSYQNFTLGIAVLLFAAAVGGTVGMPRLIAYMMGSPASRRAPFLRVARIEHYLVPLDSREEIPDW